MPSQAVQIKTGGTAAKAASRPGLAPESALRLHPCRALSSAPVSTSVGRQSRQTKARHRVAMLHELSLLLRFERLQLDDGLDFYTQAPMSVNGGLHTYM